MSKYEEIADLRVGLMSGPERDYLGRLLDEPTEEYKALVVTLHAGGCEFPKQQAALMLRNSPGVARALVDG